MTILEGYQLSTRRRWARRAVVAVIIAALIVASFVLGRWWEAFNAPILPQDAILSSVHDRAVDDIAREFKLSAAEKETLRHRPVVALADVGVNCVVFLTSQNVARWGWSEWNYRVCYSDDGKVLRFRAS